MKSTIAFISTLILILIYQDAFSQFDRVSYNLSSFQDTKDSIKINPTRLLNYHLLNMNSSHYEILNINHLWQEEEPGSETGFIVGALAGSVIGISSIFICKKINNNNSLGYDWNGNISPLGAGIMGGLYGIVVGSELGYEIERSILTELDTYKKKDDLDYHRFIEKQINNTKGNRKLK